MLDFKSDKQRERKGGKNTRPNVCWWDVIGVANGTETLCRRFCPTGGPIRGAGPAAASSFTHSTSTVQHELIHSDNNPKIKMKLWKRGQEEVQCGLTGCRWRVEGDLGAVRAKHGVPAASHPEGVQAVGVQVAHDGAGSKHPVRGPPQPAVLAILLGRGLAQPEVRGQST